MECGWLSRLAKWPLLVDFTGRDMINSPYFLISLPGLDVIKIPLSREIRNAGARPYDNRVREPGWQPRSPRTPYNINLVLGIMFRYVPGVMPVSLKFRKTSKLAQIAKQLLFVGTF